MQKLNDEFSGTLDATEERGSEVEDRSAINIQNVVQRLKIQQHCNKAKDMQCKKV